MNDILEALTEIVRQEVPGANTSRKSTIELVRWTAIEISINGFWVGTIYVEDGTIKYHNYKFRCIFGCELADPECFAHLGAAVRQSIPQEAKQL